MSQSLLNFSGVSFPLQQEYRIISRPVKQLMSINVLGLPEARFQDGLQSVPTCVEGFNCSCPSYTETVCERYFGTIQLVVHSPSWLALKRSGLEHFRRMFQHWLAYQRNNPNQWKNCRGRDSSWRRRINERSNQKEQQMIRPFIYLSTYIVRNDGNPNPNPQEGDFIPHSRPNQAQNSFVYLCAVSPPSIYSSTLA